MSDPFYDLCDQCPFNIRTQPVDWVEWMQAAGYAKRMNGNTLNKGIVDYLVSHPHIENRVPVAEMAAAKAAAE